VPLDTLNAQIPYQVNETVLVGYSPTPGWAQEWVFNVRNGTSYLNVSDYLSYVAVYANCPTSPEELHMKKAITIQKAEEDSFDFSVSALCPSTVCYVEFFTNNWEQYGNSLEIQVVASWRDPFVVYIPPSPLPPTYSGYFWVLLLGLILICILLGIVIIYLGSLKSKLHQAYAEIN